MKGVTMQTIDAIRQGINRFSQAFGNLLVDVFHFFALFAIGGTIVWSAVFMGILLISGGILLLAFATLVIRYGSAKYPSAESAGK